MNKYQIQVIPFEVMDLDANPVKVKIWKNQKLHPSIVDDNIDRDSLKGDEEETVFENASYGLTDATAEQIMGILQLFNFDTTEFEKLEAE